MGIRSVDQVVDRWHQLQGISAAEVDKAVSAAVSDSQPGAVKGPVDVDEGDRLLLAAEYFASKFESPALPAKLAAAAMSGMETAPKFQQLTKREKASVLESDGYISRGTEALTGLQAREVKPRELPIDITHKLLCATPIGAETVTGPGGVYGHIVQGASNEHGLVVARFDAKGEQLSVDSSGWP